MIAESQIREKLGRYLRGEWALEQFEDWIAQSSWNMHKDSDELAQKLASAIELRLAEHSSGHLDECALRDELRQLVNPKVVQIVFGAAPARIPDEPSDNVTASSSSQVIAFPVRVESIPVGPEFSGIEQSVAHG
jgi:hypothetical protein